MTILSDRTLRKLRPVMPFFVRTISHGKTFGLGPSGYDVRVEFDPNGKKESKWILPKGFILASTVEYFKMPDNVAARVHDKSSWARKGVTMQNTFIEAGWEGFLTLEITNHKWWPVKLKRGEPIAHIVFEYLDEAAEYPYRGKYQKQERGPQVARDAI